MNKVFIEELTDTIESVEHAARDRFGALTGEQLNWRPEPGRWSVGQCLSHLITANTPYFAIFEGVRTGARPANFWERVPVLPGLWGSMLVNAVDPNTKRKIKAPKIFAPAGEDVDAGIVDQFCAQQPKLIEAIQLLASTDLDRTIVTSPVARPITYSLRHALLVVVRHEERHLNQAAGVLESLPATL